MPSDIAELVAFFEAFYAAEAPRMVSDHFRIEPASETQIAVLQDLLGDALPVDYRTFLTRARHAIHFEKHFISLDASGVIREHSMMMRLLAAGAFNGWVESRDIDSQNYGIREGIVRRCWWDSRWLPFAEDGGGNTKCIDLDPGPAGVRGQIIAMEKQCGQGPVATEYRSFTDFLVAQRDLIEAGKYRIEDGYLELDRDA